MHTATHQIRLAIKLGCALAMAAATTALIAAPVPTKPATGEARLAKLLEGRTPGKPVDCITLSTSHDSEIIDKTAIVYGSGTTIYVNRPSNVDQLRSDDIMVVSPTGNELCHLDTIHMKDRTSLMDTGFVGLEKFVPWRRAAKVAPAR